MTRELLQQALDALTLAIGSHGRMLMSDPPQETWKFNRVDTHCGDAIRALQAELAKPEQAVVPFPAFMQQALDALKERNLVTDDSIEGKAIAALEAELAKQLSLDKKADNARELGLDYEVEQEPVAWVGLTITEREQI
jgi:hypothetical protein